MNFVHLHNHTHFSILKWLPKPKDYIKKAKSLGMEAVAITDTSNIHWTHEFYKYAKEEGIKPILWTEIYLKSNIFENMFHLIVLLAKNHDWFKNIIKLNSISNLERPWDKPYITWDELKKYSSDIICLSWPISWEISYLILTWASDEKILNKINDYKEVFKDDFYVELMYHDDIPKQKLVTDKLISLHNQYNFKVVAANNCYYINKEDKKTQDIIMALWSWHELENPDRPTLTNWDYSFLSQNEMLELFWFLPTSISNTIEIAGKVDINIDTWKVLIPKYELPIEDKIIFEEAVKAEEKDLKKTKKLSSDEWYLRYLSFKWLNFRYNFNLSNQDILKLIRKKDIIWLQKELTKTSPEELKEISLTYYTDEKIDFLKNLSKDFEEKIDRLEYELLVVHEMWFDAYFLIVADYISWAKDNDIPVWPWRWSAAWSLMAYLTKITDIDPLPYYLLFERFLNPARVSMPDIDTDFADDWRDKVIEYCRQKYWNDHVAQICTFWTFAARASVKDVWRVMWINFQEMNELAKLIPEKPWTKLISALEESLEFKSAYENNEIYKDIIDNALKIEWNVRQVWVHACAVIIAPNPMTDYTALSHPPKDTNAIITQYSAYPLEDLGLLKMDFLWLRNLTIIKRALKIIKNNKNIDIDILNLSMDDKKVFEIFWNWDTTWVFQFESDWMRKYLTELKPSSFEDLIAMVSLYRPGPLAYIPSFIKRKHKEEKVEYMTQALIDILKKSWYSDLEIENEKNMLENDLKPILDVSYWIAVYQEQLMFIVQSMGWFSLWEADLLRRWIWKKKREIIEALKIEFIEKSQKFKWYKKETPKFIYEEMIEPRANYSFNKSHARCYALIAYQTAYLKAHFKTEFLTSLMVSDEENLERVAMEVWECLKNEINVLPPSINESKKHFTYINDKTIRFWLKAIKWIWDGPIEAIKNWRQEKKYESLDDFISRAWKEVINKKSLESLILSWSLDDFWNRWELFKNIENIIKFSREKDKIKTTNQIWLFDNISWEKNEIKLEQFDDFSFEEKLFWEKEVLWFFVSGHPLDGLSRYISKRSSNDKDFKLPFDKVENTQRDKKPQLVQSVWYIRDFRKAMTKSWQSMLIIYLESFYYDFEVTIFPKDYDKYKDLIEIWKFLIVSWHANINKEFQKKSIFVRELKVISISQVLEQAKSLNLFDNKKYNTFIKKEQIEVKEKVNDINYVKDESINIDENLDELNIEKKDDYIEVNDDMNIDKYIINIDKTTKKEKLNELKSFLLSQKNWNIKILLNFDWKEIDTKISLDNLTNLKDFIKINF